MQTFGFAKKKFFDSYQKAPWRSIVPRQSGCPNWPFLELFLSQHRIAYIDYDLTCRLLCNDPSVGQEVALFICHLIMASKQGHLCVQVTSDSLSPSVQKLWQDEDGCPLPGDESSVITRLILEGSKRIPPALLSEPPVGEEFSTPICKNGSQYYLHRMWVYETLFLKSLRSHLQAVPELALDQSALETSVSELAREGILLEEQAEAIMHGCTESLTLITGGPGTGKTYTAGHLIKTFWHQLSDDDRRNCQVLLAAPTGKAASNLQKSINRAVSSLEGFPAIQAQTLHALLGLNRFSPAREAPRLTADLLIVDECSMIDVRMMAALFASLKPGSRLVMLGDKDQLPAVEAGSVFADLVDFGSSNTSFSIPCIILRKCMRAELTCLVELAQSINEGNQQKVLEQLNHPKGPGVRRLLFSHDKTEALHQLADYAAPFFPSSIHLGHKPDLLLEIFGRIRLLSPVRKGPLGVEALNHLIWEKICEKVPMNGFLAIPIMITANDYRQELFNGETGVLIRRLPLQSLTPDDFAFFPSRLDEGAVRRFSAVLLPKHELAYCLSVHKSQGSEFDHIILMMPEGSELFGREVFYTAATRARKSLEIYSSDSVIKQTVEHKGGRLSGLVQRMTTKEWLEG